MGLPENTGKEAGLGKTRQAPEAHKHPWARLAGNEAVMPAAV